MLREEVREEAERVRKHESYTLITHTTSPRIHPHHSLTPKITREQSSNVSCHQTSASSDDAYAAHMCLNTAFEA